MRNDNLLVFIPADCKITSETGQELIVSNRIIYNDLKREDPKNLRVGNVIVIKYENYSVFHAVIKETFDSRPYLSDISNTLWALKHAMNELQVKTISVSTIGNVLYHISWPCIESKLRELFGQLDYKISVCYGEREIPLETDRQKIIHEHHCSTTGGRKGSTKIYERIRENFYSPNMREQILKFVKDCENCKLNKTVRVKTKLPMQIIDIPSEAFEKIEIDIVGPLPETELGNKYILTIQDSLTKFSDAIPLRSTESAAIASALAEQCLTLFGCPEFIHTHQGSNFTSRVMDNLCKIFKIKHI